MDPMDEDEYYRQLIRRRARRRRQHMECVDLALSPNPLQGHLLLLLLHMQQSELPLPSYEVPRKKYTRRTFLWELSTWSASKFQRRMRMTKSQFQLLLPGFSNSANFTAAGCSSSRRITTEVWLAGTICDLASGTTLEKVCKRFGLAESSYSAKREQLMMALVDACLAADQRPLGIPTTTEGWNQLADTFARPEYPEFDVVRVCLVGDGTLIGFSPYGARDHHSKEKWRCSNGFLATKCLFYFDGHRRAC
eukprot:m.29102 g.29102  ORF g.29102 m.29102 type:complete len:250 (-) comp11923_c0_seq1:783-1532(-)